VHINLYYYKQQERHNERTDISLFKFHII
jgi:hypothetical protein